MPFLKKLPNSIGSIAIAPTITDGIASSTSGSVTTHGDSCGFSPAARPWWWSCETSSSSWSPSWCWCAWFWPQRSLPWKTRKYMRNE
ncbi:hypothetical protein D3C72_2165940 [compost metagenome]